MPLQALSERKSGEPFQCPKCGATYPHDGGYRHECFDCPKREGVTHGRAVKVGLGRRD